MYATVVRLCYRGGCRRGWCRWRRRWYGGGCYGWYSKSSRLSCYGLNTTIMKTKEEKISRVKSKVNGDEFYSSNLYRKMVDGHTFIGVFKQPPESTDRHINWMRKDFVVEVKLDKKR